MYVEGPEYGSMKTALKSCMESVDRLADCHIAVKDRLMSVVQARVKEWRNEHYKKSLIGACREAKLFEDDFRKVCYHLIFACGQSAFRIGHIGPTVCCAFFIHL